MTVCVAAISNTGMIIGATDRMLSNLEVAYEPDSRKVWTFTSAISALWSGDPSILSEVLGAVQRDVQSVLASDPLPDWFSVKEMVDLYVAHWTATKRGRATATYLAPLGLSMEDFIEKHRSLDPAVADRLTTAIVNHPLPFTSCIIAGIDHTGAHIWVVNDGVAACYDAVGFAVIGAGQRHADSQMISGKHSPTKTPSETLVLVHMAKKRAEVTPSVGAATDILLIGPSLGQHGPLPDYHLAKLDADFSALRVAERAAFSSAVDEFDAYLATLNNQPEGPQAPDDDDGDGADDELTGGEPEE